jgi:hypothetical protein
MPQCAIAWSRPARPEAKQVGSESRRPPPEARGKIRIDEPPQGPSAAKKDEKVLARRERGLIGTAARTAVIAGIATAVSNKVGRQQDAAHRAAAAGEGASSDRIAQLERLTKLKDSGALTEDEFEREKAKLLGG